MALTFPLSLAQFWDQLKVAEITNWKPTVVQSVAQLGDGTVLRSTRGATLWRGTAQLTPGYHEDAARIEALLSLLEYPGASFLAYDPRKPTLTVPAFTGSPTIGSISSSRRDMTLANFTGTITPGDLLSFTYGSSPTRYALHRAVTGATGTQTFEVTPPIRLGAAVGAAVTLTKPVAKCVLAPDPSYGSGRPLITAGASFNIVQTLG